MLENIPTINSAFGGHFMAFQSVMVLGMGEPGDCPGPPSIRGRPSYVYACDAYLLINLLCTITPSNYYHFSQFIRLLLYYFVSTSLRLLHSAF